MRLLDAAADLLLGAACPGCETPGWGLCGECRAALAGEPRPVAGVLDVPVLAACHYDLRLRRVIPRFKDDGALHLDSVLGGLLARSVAALGPPDGAVLVPVPSLPRHVRARGYDHARRLAAVAARRLGLRRAWALRRARGGLDQRGLTRGQRGSNLEGSMRASPVDRPAVIIDDVVTTGATLREAHRALSGVGTVVIGAAVIAEVDNLATPDPKG